MRRSTGGLMADQDSTLVGCLLMLALPFIALWCFLVIVPYSVARHLIRWYQLPRWKRESINARARAEVGYTYEKVDAAIRAELLAHGLMDTPANRGRINRSARRRLK